MSGTSIRNNKNEKKVYLNGDLVAPLPKVKLYEKISQLEINQKIIDRQKEVQALKEGGDVKED